MDHAGHGAMVEDGVANGMDHTDHNGQPAMDHDAMDMMDEHDHEKMMQDAAEANLPVGIDEKLGNYLPDVPFLDSEGHPVSLKKLADIPVLLLPIYFRCPDVCNLLQSSIAGILDKVKLEPGREYKVVSLSFDAREKPKDAARAKRTYLAAAGKGFPTEDWLFLTGRQQSIDMALQSVGYTVQKQNGLWAHPVAAIAIAPGGKVVCYLYGTSFLPFDLTMGLTEASEGKTGLSVKRLLSFCYNYDPEGRRYVFDILRVAGFAIVGFVIVFLVWLLVGGKKKRE